VAQGCTLCRLAIGKIVQDCVFNVLFVGGAAGAARRTLLGAVEQNGLPGFADAIAGRAPHLSHKGKHAAKDFAQRHQVVLRDPRRQFHQLRGQDRLLIKHCFDQTGLDRRSFIVQAGYHTNQLLVAERHDHPAAHGRVVIVL
jgi:hypothetical protein